MRTTQCYWKRLAEAVSAIDLCENFVVSFTGENDSCIRAGLRIVEVRRDPRSSLRDAGF
jgi:hypothetical protein